MTRLLKPDEAGALIGVEETLLTAKELAGQLKVSEAWVRQHASGFRRPKLPSMRLGGAIRFRPSAIAEFLKSMEQ